MMKLARLLPFVALFAFSAARADNVELRIATLAPDNSSWTETLDKAAAEVKDKTSGRVQLKYFKGGSQGDEQGLGGPEVGTSR